MDIHCTIRIRDGQQAVFFSTRNKCVWGAWEQIRSSGPWCPCAGWTRPYPAGSGSACTATGKSQRLVNINSVHRHEDEVGTGAFHIWFGSLSRKIGPGPTPPVVISRPPAMENNRLPRFQSGFHKPLTRWSAVENILHADEQFLNMSSFKYILLQTLYPQM